MHVSSEIPLLLEASNKLKPRRFRPVTPKTRVEGAFHLEEQALLRTLCAAETHSSILSILSQPRGSEDGATAVAWRRSLY